MKLVLQDEKLLVYYCTVFKVSTSSKYHVGEAKTQLDVWGKKKSQTKCLFFQANLCEAFT